MKFRRESSRNGNQNHRNKNHFQHFHHHCNLCCRPCGCGCPFLCACLTKNQNEKGRKDICFRILYTLVVWTCAFPFSATGSTNDTHPTTYCSATSNGIVSFSVLYRVRMSTTLDIVPLSCCVSCAYVSFVFVQSPTCRQEEESQRQPR